MKILAIDTSGTAASCAVMSDGKVLHSVFMQHGLTHSQTIMPAVEYVMQASGLSCGEMDAFAAVIGPGSFTGVRIGVCTVKGLAHAVGKPCAPVHALEALAMNFYGFDGVVCPILDARRGQVYTALFDVRDGIPRRVMADEAIALEALMEKLPKDRRIMFAGDGLPVFRQQIREALGDRALLAPAGLSDLRAESVCLIASSRAKDWVPAHALQPCYLRASQAERLRAEQSRREAGV